MILVNMVIKNSLVFLFLLLFLSTVHASNDCPVAYCDKNGPIIQFPFWLQGTPQPQKCAPPGFNLSCNGQRYPILHIPGSGDFYLRSVYYYIRIVTLQDVESCLPQRLLSFNLSSTPFTPVQHRTYTFFSCPKGSVYSTSAVDCASNATSDFFAVDGQEESSLKFSNCTKIATVPVPVSPYYNFGFPDDLDLTWESVPNCQNCGSTTGGKNGQSDFSSTILFVTIPIMFVLFAIVGCVCRKNQGGSNQNSSSSIQISEVGGLRGRGMDISIIETYKKITIGESCIEGPIGIACTICLADYVPNDTLRFMPECEHCFHVECIDKWLSMSRKCPICRISLPHANIT